MSVNDSNLEQALTEEELGKKAYSPPMLSWHGLVRELTTSGSDPDKEQGDGENPPRDCSQDARDSCKP